MGLASSELITAGWILIAVYVAVTLFFVIRGALKVKTMNDYAVGNVNFPPWTVGFALAASMTSAATFVINPGLVATYGISAFISYGLVYPAAAMISLVVLTIGFRKFGSSVKAGTLAQWMGKKYESKGFALYFAILSLLLLTFIVLIAVGLTKVISKTLDVPELYVLIATIVFIFGYMMFGGANSMVYTNTVQAIIMLFVAFIMIGSGYAYFQDGVTGFIDKLGSIDGKLTQLYNESSFLFRDFFEIFIAQIVIGAAIVCQPHIITKSLLIKDPKGVKSYLISGVIAQGIFFLVVFVGLYARLQFPELKAGDVALKTDGIIPAYVVSVFPVFISLFVVLGLISAGISTLEGLIQSLSSTITQDLIKPYITDKFVKKELTDRAMIIINRSVIGILGIVAVLMTYDQLVNPKLSVAIFAQNGVYAYFSAAFVPIIFGMFMKDVNKTAVIISSVIAVAVHFTMYYGKLTVPFTVATGENPGVAAAVAILISILSGLILQKLLGGRK
ncbi:MAG: sodium:solute symporter [Ignavibacteriales bacterium]|mgnify:CR=1 FL=1|jgi:sodium/pantothenate symporter|nr:sodium:solute symporter [Ignavibacteriales bacterium]MBP9122106.1 sodium:solute symporter [Ignavibacteriaceae bacterium]